MSQTQIPLGTPTGIIEFTDTAMGNAPDAVKASSALLYSVFIDNSANVGAACYVKLYNALSGNVTVGTTAPDEVIYVPAGARITVSYFTGATPGKTFATGLTAACVTAGGTGGSTPPSSSVPVSIIYV